MREFNLLTLSQFEQQIASVDPGRAINHIQIHHTWKPTLKSYVAAIDREAVIRGMHTYHTTARGMKDIAQHFTVVPEGIWDGRPMAMDPGGFYGAENRGGICFELVGDFDIGREALTGMQLQNTLRAVRACRRRWSAAAIVFHREKNPAKSCPGSGIRKDWFMAQLASRTWEQIIEAAAGRPDEWKAAIQIAVNAAKADGNLGALEILKYLPDLLEKTYELGRESKEEQHV